ncbi:MAG TPA: Sec-dependent nitrous-oxide reductase [Balneolaceae bacterium]|nr:Sec-dependent nitrous-oxide reductase [Balneolaceae bacterium]
MSPLNYLKNSGVGAIILAIVLILSGCSSPKSEIGNEDAAGEIYVPPGKHDEFYSFMSGGWTGNISVYGIPSGRHLYTIPVFSQTPTNGYGYTEETKAMLNTSFGLVPWGDTHHIQPSKTNGDYDGRWIFINDRNTPRIARIDLKTFRTDEIIEIPNTAGQHSSAFVSSNTEYVSANTEYSIPLPEPMGSGVDVPIASYKKNFHGTISLIKVDQKTGQMDIGFQIQVPPFDYDLGRFGLGVSKDWVFYTMYNTEQAHTLLEVNASQNDKDFVLAVNWKKAEQAAADGKGQLISSPYVHNLRNPETGIAESETKEQVRVLKPSDLQGAIYYMPAPKSPHGINVSPDGEYISEGGKLSTVVPVQSFTKMINAIQNNDTTGSIQDIPILKYESVLAYEVKDAGLGPLHVEYDGEGHGYNSDFISSEIVKWDLKTGKVLDRHPAYYSTGHLTVAGGDTRHPYGKYLIALNKITKDRYLPTGPEMFAGEQLFDISGDKMKLILDFPVEGEPHNGAELPASLIDTGQVQYFKLSENRNPYVTRTEHDTKVVRDGKRVDVYMTAIRSHFTPDNIEGIKVGDTVYLHVTNLEQEWDIPHGFALKGMLNSGMLIMPGETRTNVWKPLSPGIYPFYCTDFCSALHQEMQGYVRVSPENSDVKLTYGTNKDL